MSAPLTALVWRDGMLEPVDRAPRGELLASDSWLVDEGRVRAYDAHWERFAGWCADLRVDPMRLAGFREAATAALPRTGRWFPRLDLVASTGGQADLVLRLRPAPALMREARVLVAEPGDLRSCPQRKGADLPLLLALRAQAVAAGADELLLCDSGGRLLEGALSSLLWWEEDTLCTTPDERTLPSVTRLLLLTMARELGFAVRRRSPLPVELDGRETWLANAAHGICVVVGWAPGAMAAGPAVHVARWRSALDAAALHLDG